MTQTATASLAPRAAGRIDWHVEPAWRAALLEEGGLPLARWIREGLASIVKDGPHRTVYRVDLPAHSVYVKHYRCRRWLRIARHLFRSSSSRREWHSTREVARRNVPTVEPVAWGEERRAGLAADSFFVTAALPDAVPLDHYLDVELPRLPPPRRAAARRQLVAALARFTAAAHTAGVDHDDFHTGNLLVQIGADTEAAAPREFTVGEAPRLFLIDLPGVRLTGPLNWRRTRGSLAMLNATLLRRSTPRERWRFWREYLRQRTDLRLDDPRAAALDVAQRSRRHLLRVLRGRDDRALRENRDFQRLSNAAGAACGTRDIAAADLRAMLGDPAALLRRARHDAVKISHRSLIVAVQLPSMQGPLPAALKRWRETSLWKRLLARFRRSRALTAWRLGHALCNRGIATARPLAVIEPAGGGESYLATAWIAGAENLHQFCWRIAALPARERTRRARPAAAALGRLIGRLHAWQIGHRDLKGCNLVLAENDDGVAAWLVDLEGVRIRRRLRPREQARDLARLATSLELHPWITRGDRRRFLRAYLAEFPELRERSLAARRLWRAVAPRSHKLTARLLQRGGVA